MPTARNTASTKSNADTKKKAGIKAAIAKTETIKAEAGKAPRTTRRTASAQTKPSTTTAPCASSQRIAPEQRQQYIEVAAYFIAERRGFVDGDQTCDWFAAEAEIDRLIEENKLND